jgi:NAD(P)-dependent dehydrogenase (short-subunit alcohol dehydrogenase family)
MLELNDRRCVVTGCARGIGRAIAVAMARSGCDVGGFDVLDPTATAAEVTATGRRAYMRRGDASSWDDVYSFAEEAVRGKVPPRGAEGGRGGKAGRTGAAYWDLPYNAACSGRCSHAAARGGIVGYLPPHPWSTSMTREYRPRLGQGRH